MARVGLEMRCSDRSEKGGQRKSLEGKEGYDWMVQGWDRWIDWGGGI